MYRKDQRGGQQRDRPDHPDTSPAVTMLGHYAPSLFISYFACIPFFPRLSR
jgi:hypothetical protein